jgi:hypothetical protein
MCNDIGADFPSAHEAAAVDGTVDLIRTRCNSLSSQPTANLITAQNNIKKWYQRQEEPKEQDHLKAYEYIMGKLAKAVKNRPSLADLWAWAGLLWSRWPWRSSALPLQIAPIQYEVAASGYYRADQGEFLYDMVWYQLDRGFVLRQPMVMEVDYAVSPTNTVDDDFQKLVQARADVRVWITTCENLSDMDRHVANCEKQIRLFAGSQLDDQYVLLFFEWDTRTCVVRRLP